MVALASLVASLAMSLAALAASPALSLVASAAFSLACGVGAGLPEGVSVLLSQPITSMQPRHAPRTVLYPIMEILLIRKLPCPRVSYPQTATVENGPNRPMSFPSADPPPDPPTAPPAAPPGTRASGRSKGERHTFILTMIAMAALLFLMTEGLLYFRWVTMTEPSCILVIVA